MIFPSQERQELYSYCQDRLGAFASAHSCRVLNTEGNPISLALTLDCLRESSSLEISDHTLPLTHLGSMLFHRCVSGTRVIIPGVQQKVAGITFTGYGAHYDQYPHSYLTLAASLGTQKSDIDVFMTRLEKSFRTFKKQNSERT